MVLSVERASAILSVVYLTLKNAGSSLVEVVGYYIDRYKSIGAYLRIEPDSTGVLPVHVDSLEKGKHYRVCLEVKGKRGLEGPFDILV